VREARGRAEACDSFLAVDISTLHELSRHSQALAQQLFSRFPEWRAYASADRSGRELFIEVPSPSEDPARSLRLFVEDGVPCLVVGEWHTHADLWPDEQHFLSFLDDVVSDRVLFLVVSTRAARWTVIEGPCLEVAMDVLTGPSAPDAVRIVSWTGAKDQTLRREDL